MAIRVVIGEDAAGFAVLARSWLAEDPELEVVAVEPTAAGVIEAAGRLTPDVILLDRTLPDAVDVDSVVRGLRARAPDSAIVLMSSMPADVLAQDAQRVGAQASIPKTVQAHELRATVRSAGERRKRS